MALATAALAYLSACIAPIVAAANCPNEGLRQQQASTYLPSCMAFEMATPPEKGSKPATVPSFSADGERVVFNSPAALGGTLSLVNATGDLYVASRGETGWSTVATSLPSELGLGGGGERYSLPRTFSPDLSRWFSFQATQPQLVEGQMTVYEGTLGSIWRPRSPLLAPIGGPRESEVVKGSAFGAVSPDLSHLYFRPGNNSSPGTAYLPGDPQPSSVPGFLSWNTYVVAPGSLGEPTVELLARDSSGTAWGGNCGSWVGGGEVGASAPLIPGGRNQGAVSTDGSKVYFSTRPAQPQPEVANPALPACDTANPIRILVREETPGGPQISPFMPGGPAAGSDFFEGASVDGSRVYFTSSRKLAPSDQDPSSEECTTDVELPVETSKGCDLYLYEETPAGSELVQVSAGGTGDATPGQGANVYEGVTAISGDGSHVYFVAQDALTTDPSPEGEVAVPGRLNLYAYQRNAAHPDGHTAFIGELDPVCGAFGTGGGFERDDCHALAGRPVSYYNDAVAAPLLGKGPAGQELGGDGHILVFASYAQLSANDTDGRHRDIFRYDGEEIECVSCRPGGPDSEPFDIGSRQTDLTAPGADFAERQQWVSEDGNSIVFTTAEPLLPGDIDGAENPYLWRSGLLTRLPGARRAGAGAVPRPTVSHSGREVAFQTSTALLPQDRDTAEDVYVARVDGGFPNPLPSASLCVGAEECQGPAAPAPAAGDPASGAFLGSGNVKPRRHGKSRKCPKGKHKAKRGGKVRCVNNRRAGR